jgi:hypothetical protein
LIISIHVGWLGAALEAAFLGFAGDFLVDIMSDLVALVWVRQRYEEGEGMRKTLGLNVEVGS